MVSDQYGEREYGYWHEDREKKPDLCRDSLIPATHDKRRVLSREGPLKGVLDQGMELLRFIPCYVVFVCVCVQSARAFWWFVHLPAHNIS